MPKVQVYVSRDLEQRLAEADPPIDVTKTCQEALEVAVAPKSRRARLLEIQRLVREVMAYGDGA